MNKKLQELKKVTWVKRKDAIVSFLWVFVFTLVSGLFIYAVDILAALIFRQTI